MWWRWKYNLSINFPVHACAAQIPHLVELGVTAVELLPVFEYDELEFQRTPNPRDHMVNIWGYSHLSFFAPMSRSWNPTTWSSTSALGVCTSQHPKVPEQSITQSARSQGTLWGAFHLCHGRPCPTMFQILGCYSQAPGPHGCG